MADPFAPPLAKLGNSGIAVAAAPSGGKGLALTPDGKLPDAIRYSLLQLVSDGKDHKIAFGNSSGTYPGGTNFSNQLVIPHGLGTTPICIIANGNSTTVADFGWQSAGPDATNIYIKMVAVFVQPPLGTTAACCWIAIG